MPNEKTQIAVAAILNDLEVPFSVEGKEDRLKIQKAIYLSQAAGAKLGYSYNWYLNGPYSPSLTEDYYDAQTRIHELSEYVVSDELASKLAPVRKLLALRPKDVSEVEWLEATASLDYMVRVQGKKPNEVVGICKEQKRHLAGVLPSALEALQQTLLAF